MNSRPNILKGFVVKFEGGLGNQMFQYALGRSLSLMQKTTVSFDFSWFNTQTKRKYELAHLNVVVKPAGDLELKKWREQQKKPSFQSALTNLFKNEDKAYVREKSFSFDPGILKISPPAYFDGFWQSEKYFRDFGEVIRDDLKLKESLVGRNLQIANKIISTNSISLHIRRGDYINDKRTNAYHGVSGLDYYQSAVSYLKNQVSQPSYFVFSDDIEWAKSNLKLGDNVSFIDWNQGDTDYIDMKLMSLCRHNIIANSSFSWWGAWLNDNSKKIVISPKSWFTDPSIDTSDLIPSDWVRL